MKKISMIALLFFFMMAGQSPVSFAFTDCGYLVEGVECVLFQADSGGLYIVGDLGGFEVGDRVQVTGTLDPGCLSICMQGDGCIIGGTISPCSDPPWWPPSVEIVPEYPTSSDVVAITLSGEWPGCEGPQGSFIRVQGNDIYFDVVGPREPFPPGPFCPPTPWELTGSVGPLQPGTYAVYARVYWQRWVPLDDPWLVEYPAYTYLTEFTVTPSSYYVDATNGNDDNNGWTPETAFATIQKGIDSALDGATVLVCPAVYTEAIDFKGKAIAVEGVATPAGIAAIEAPGDFAVSFYGGEGPNSVLNNFVIRDSNMAAWLSDASPTMSHLTVVDNAFGVGAYGSSEPDISNCILWNNTDGDLFGCEAQYSWVEEDINEPAGPTEGLISHWKFNEGSKPIAYDSAGSNDGIIYGAQWTSGRFGGALNFDGDRDYVVIPDDDSLSPSSEMSISFWVCNRGGQDAGIYKYAACPSEGGSPGNSRAYLMRIADIDHKVALRIFSSVSNYDDIYSNSVVPLNTWHHITGTFNRGEAAIYIDGELDSVGAMSVTSIANDEQPLIIGGQWSYCGGDHFVSCLNGVIDEVRLYGQALSADEIGQLYDGEPSPLFADADNGDYHLKSKRGRFWPEHNIWVLDDVTSPGVDGGDPRIDPSPEPAPNGGRVNIGAYGGTAYASMSEWPIKGDVNYDGVYNMIDFAILAEGWLQVAEWRE